MSTTVRVDHTIASKERTSGPGVSVDAAYISSSITISTSSHDSLRDDPTVSSRAVERSARRAHRASLSTSPTQLHSMNNMHSMQQSTPAVSIAHVSRRVQQASQVSWRLKRRSLAKSGGVRAKETKASCTAHAAARHCCACAMRKRRSTACADSRGIASGAREPTPAVRTRSSSGRGGCHLHQAETASASAAAAAAWCAMHTHVARRSRASASSVGSGACAEGWKGTNVPGSRLERSKSPRLPSRLPPISRHRGRSAPRSSGSTKARPAAVRFARAPMQMPGLEAPAHVQVETQKSQPHAAESEAKA